MAGWPIGWPRAATRSRVWGVPLVAGFVVAGPAQPQSCNRSQLHPRIMLAARPRLQQGPDHRTNTTCSPSVSQLPQSAKRSPRLHPRITLLRVAEAQALEGSPRRAVEAEDREYDSEYGREPPEMDSGIGYAARSSARESNLHASDWHMDPHIPPAPPGARTTPRRG